jgi:glyoxylase-like metal-dependent hydrolase (beta-lactamase superfamily II)
MKLFDDLHAFFWTDPTTNNANTYLVNGPNKVLIDPGHAHLFGVVKAQLELLGLSPRDIDLVIATHAHPDHMEALHFFSGAPALVAFPKPEFEAIAGDPLSGGLIVPEQFEPDILLQEGTLSVGETTMEVYWTPGHSPGSICIYWPSRRALFSGDVVFKQGLGRTDLPGGSGQALKQSIRELSYLDVELLLPGHGEPVHGRDAVRRNFDDIERTWFGFL